MNIKTAVCVCAVGVALGVGATEPGASIPASAYLQRGLVGLWDGIENAGAGLPHDGAATTWKDLSGNGYDGTVSSIVSWTDNGWTNASDGQPVTVGSAIAGVLKQSPYTIEMVVAPASLNRRFTYFGNYSNQGFGIENYYGNGGGDARKANGMFRLYNNGSPDIGTGMAGEAGVINGFSFVATPSHQQYYKNGALATTTAMALTTLASSGCNTIIGGELERPAMAFKGTYHALRLYNRALTPDEVAVNANIDKIRFEGAEPAELVWPEGYRYDAVSQKLQVRIAATCDTVRGSVTVGDAPIGSDGLWVDISGTCELKATPAEGWRFVRWNGPDDPVLAAEPTIQLTVSRPLSLTAVFDRADALTANSYVQSGLVAQWDAIDNVGTGTHDATATTWKNLVGANAAAYDMTLTANGSFTDTALVSDGKKTAAKGTSPAVPIGQIEGCYTLDSDKTANSVIYATGLASGGYMDWCIAVLSTHRGFLFGGNTSMFAVGNDYSGLHTVSSTKSVCHYDGVSDTVTKGANNGFSTSTARMVGTSAVGGFGDSDTLCAAKVHAIRLYNRALTPAEAMRNAAIDKIRFLGAEQAESEGWRFNAESKTLEIRVSAIADGDGTVGVDDEGSVAEQGATAEKWFEFGQEGKVVVTATPAEGQVFVAWSGDASLTAEQKTSTTLTLAADRVRKLTAHFVAAESDRWTYSQTAGQISCGTTILNVTATAGVEGGLTVSGVSAFDGGLIDLRLPIVGAEDGCWYVVTSVGAVLNSNLTVTELRLPDTMKELAANAFSGAANLTKVVLPSGLTKIGDNAFLNCYELTDVVPFLPNSVTNVGASVFESCTNLSGKICLHGAIRIGANIVKTTKVGEVDLDGAPLYSFGAGNYSSVTNFHPLLPPTVGGSCPPSWSGANLGGHQKLCLCSPNFTYLSGDNVRYNTWSDIDMTGSSIAKTGSWCFYGCGSLTNVIFSEAFTTFPNASAAFGNCGALRWVRFRGDPPQALTSNPFGGHAGMCYYFPKWSEEWETYIAEGVKPDGETTVDCKVSEMTSDECKNFLSAHPGEPIPTQRISIGGAGTRAITTTKGFLWWYPKAPPVYKTVALFDLLRYQEQAGIAPADDEMAPKLFDGTTYTYCKETAHLALRWLVGVDGSAEIALPAAATVARAMRTEGYRVHQMPIGDYANARAPTAWTLYGKTSDEGEWTVIDQVAMTAESANRWAYFDDPTAYPVTGKTQATPPRAQCSLTYQLPQEKWDRYVAFKFVPTGSYNQDNDVEDATPYGLMELEILGELTTSEPHIGGFSVMRRGWNDMDFAFDLDSIGDRGADGTEPQSAVAWVEVATDDTFATIVSATEPVAVTAGKGIAATVTGLAGRTTYAARVIVSNDLELTAVQTLAGGASTLEAPFELGAVTTSVGEDGRLEVTVEVKALYSAEIDLDLAYRETMNAEPASLGQKKATAAGFVVFETDVEPGKSSFVDLTAASDGISQKVTRTPFGFWLADSADAPTRISNSVTRTTFTVTKDTAGLKLSKLVDIGDTATIDLTTLVAAPDGSALAIVSPGTALNSNTDVAELLLPDTVTAIPNTACQNCSRLRKLRLPAALASIGDSAFSGCAQLAEVENFFPPTCVKLGNSSFYTCAKIPNFTLADGLESIPGNCFYGCSKITDLHIPDSVTNISGGAFAGVSSLTNFTPRFLPPQIRTASLSAFHDGNTKCSVPLVLDNPEMKSIPGDGFRYNNFTSLDMLGSSINSIGTLGFYSVPLQWIRFPTNVVTFAAHDTYTFTSTVLREVIFPGEPPVFTKNIFGSSYYIIRIPNENESWLALLEDHREKGWLTDMTDAERKTFRQRYPGVRPVPKQWLNLYGLTGKRYLMYLKGPGLMLFVR